MICAASCRHDETVTEAARGERVRRAIRTLLLGMAGLYFGTAVFERLLPHAWLRRFQRVLGNPGGLRMSRIPGWAVLETTGRRTGQPHQVPVGGRVIGESFWLVAADPDHAGYVRNIEAHPRVRVKFNEQWCAGEARLRPDISARLRMLRINPLNGLYIALAGREHLAIEVRLGPLDSNASAE
jgi:deazaflavin-dependent oxidoreductase (nitroreductase family)